LSKQKCARASGHKITRFYASWTQ